MTPLVEILRRKFLAAFGLFLVSVAVAAAAAPQVSIVVGDAAVKPVRHGIDKLEFALRERGVPYEEVPSLKMATGAAVVVAGTVSDPGPLAQLLAEQKLAPQAELEAFLIRKFNRDGKTLVLASGGDARGAMYALFDIAERVEWAPAASNPFVEVRDTDEKPFAPERALSLYTFNRAYWESRFFDEAYWARYLDLLAWNRCLKNILAGKRRRSSKEGCKQQAGCSRALSPPVIHTADFR